MQSLCHDIAVEVKTSVKIAIECVMYQNMHMIVDVKN